MKKLLSILLFFLPLTIFANHFTIGTGSGGLTLTSMSGHSSGDTALVTPGTYSSGDFENLTGITIMNNGGLVTFNGSVYIANLTNCTIYGGGQNGLTYGFYFTGFNNTAIPTGRLTNVKISRIYVYNTQSVVFDFNNAGFVYNGTTASLGSYKFYVDSCKFVKTDMVYQGSYGFAPTYQGISDSTYLTHLIIDSVYGDGNVIFGNGVFGLVAHDIIMTNTGLNGSGDRGAFELTGDILLYNIYRKGGYGYLIRLYGTGLNGRSDSYIYNCYDLSTENYGTIDYRIDPTDTTTNSSPPFLRGSSLHIYNITSGNKRETLGYTAPILVLYNYEPAAGYKCEMRNCIGFNSQIPYGGTHIYYQATADPLTDTSNNLYYANPITSNLFTDSINCTLKTGSPLVDRGGTISYFHTDYKGTIRPQGSAWDVGADELIVAGGTSVTANAGGNQTITLPTNSITLNGSGSFAVGGTITSYTWTKKSGPTGGSITSPSSASTTATGLTQGTYVYKLVVTDNNSNTSADSITVTVNPAPNQPPVANAGGNQTITLPTNSVTLNGSGSTDPDGTIASYTWSKVSGPGSGTITSPTSVSTTVTSLAQGTYIFKLTVTDNQGATGSANDTITVNPAANIPPIANAGNDQTITLPTSTVTVSASGSSDPDGTISSYSWTKISGPSTYTIVSPSAITTQINTLVQGVYQFKLTVVDNSGAAAVDTVQITVNAAPNQPPNVSVGPNQTITLPTNSVSLTGTASDPDGTIAGTVWTKTSGPSTYTITTPNSLNTTVTGLVQGTYIFTLTATDNLGSTANAPVTITVNAQAVISNGHIVRKKGTRLKLITL